MKSQETELARWYDLLVGFHNMTVIPLDVLEAVSMGGAGPIATILIAHLSTNKNQVG